MEPRGQDQEGDLDLHDFLDIPHPDMELCLESLETLPSLCTMQSLMPPPLPSAAVPGFLPSSAGHMDLAAGGQAGPQQTGLTPRIWAGLTLEDTERGRTGQQHYGAYGGSLEAMAHMQRPTSRQTWLSASVDAAVEAAGRRSSSLAQNPAAGEQLSRLARGRAVSLDQGRRELDAVLQQPRRFVRRASDEALEVTTGKAVLSSLALSPRGRALQSPRGSTLSEGTDTLQTHQPPSRTAVKSKSVSRSQSRELMHQEAPLQRSMKRLKSQSLTDMDVKSPVLTPPARPSSDQQLSSGHVSTGPRSSEQSASVESGDRLQTMQAVTQPQPAEVRPIPTSRSGFVIPMSSTLQAHAAAAWGNRVVSGSLGTPVVRPDSDAGPSGSSARTRAETAGAPENLELQHSRLVEETNVQLLGIVSPSTLPAASRVPGLDFVSSAWEALRDQISKKRKAAQEELQRLAREQSYLQAQEGRMEVIVAEMGQLQSHQVQRGQREELALRLLLTLNGRPLAARDSDMELGQQFAHFCSQLMFAYGWDNFSMGHTLSMTRLMGALANGSSMAGQVHRVTVGQGANSSWSITQLMRLPLDMFKELAKGYAASLSKLLDLAADSRSHLSVREQVQMQMARTIVEGSVVSMALACGQPWQALGVITFDDEPIRLAQASDPSFWAGVTAAACLTIEQVGSICNIHRAAEARFARLSSLRAPLKQRLTSLCAVSPSQETTATVPSESRAALLMTVTQLKQNRNDQALAVLELGATILLQVCSPVQAAAMVGKAYPLHLQPRAIAAAVALAHEADPTNLHAF